MVNYLITLMGKLFRDGSEKWKSERVKYAGTMERKYFNFHFYLVKSGKVK